MTHIRDELYERLFKPRGIDREIAEARPYVPYAGGGGSTDLKVNRTGWETIISADPKYAEVLEPENRKTVKRWIAASSGVLIVRNGVTDDPVFAEMRPDDPVPTKMSKPHKHPFPEDWSSRSQNDRESWNWYGHIFGIKGWQHHGDNTRKWTSDGWESIKPSGLHQHRHFGKYIFPPSPKINAGWPREGQRRHTEVTLSPARLKMVVHPQVCFTTDGDVIYAAQEPAFRELTDEERALVDFGDSEFDVNSAEPFLEITGYALDVTTGRRFDLNAADRHVFRYHSVAAANANGAKLSPASESAIAAALDDIGPHTHWNEITDYKEPRARRIDVHRDGWDVLRRAREEHGLVFLALEGCMKADALLSAGEAVFSVPSVSLWNAAADDELKGFAAEWLVGTTVVVVPDSDWEDKDEVIQQARTAAFVIGRFEGVSACVAAPTPEPHPCKLHADKEGVPAPAGSKRGVDDYLGDKEPVDKMPVIDRWVPNLDVWIKKTRGYATGRENRRTTLEWLALNANRDGRVHPHTATATLATGLASKKFRRALYDLVDVCAITVNGYHGDRAKDELKLRNGYWMGNGDLDFGSDALIQLDTDLRAQPIERTVADLR